MILGELCEGVWYDLLLNHGQNIYLICGSWIFLWRRSIELLLSSERPWTWRLI